MNYKWRKKYSQRNCGNSLYGIFSTKFGHMEVEVNLFLTPCLNTFLDKAIMFAKINCYIKDLNELNDFDFHNIADDCYELGISLLGNINLNKLYFIELFGTKNGDNRIPLTFGDYTYDN